MPELLVQVVVPSKFKECCNFKLLAYDKFDRIIRGEIKRRA